MRRRSLLALSGTALTTMLAGCNALGDSPTTDTTTPPDTTSGTTPADGTTTEPSTPTRLRNGSFESDWAAWRVGRDLPTDPNADADRPVASSVGVTTRDASEGTRSLTLALDGRQDDGTIWVQQAVDLSGYDYLAVDYHVSTSFNEILQAAVYAGPGEDALVERDFDRSKSLSGHDAAGWKTFVYDLPDHDGPGIVAVGVNVVWETRAIGFLDNVRLTGSEPATRTPTPSTTRDSNGSEIHGGDGRSLR